MLSAGHFAGYLPHSRIASKQGSKPGCMYGGACQAAFVVGSIIANALTQGCAATFWWGISQSLFLNKALDIFDTHECTAIDRYFRVLDRVLGR